MGKKKSKNSQSLDILISKSAPILELKYSDPLFGVILHPSEPIIVSGLATGHIYCHSYDCAKLKKLVEENEKKYASSSSKDVQQKKTWCVVDVLSKENESEGLTLLWKTRRHKGSVRSMCFEADGKFMYSIGADNVLKKSDTKTGKVVKKVTLSEKNNAKFTKILKSVSHPFLLLGDEDGNVIVLDSETLLLKNTIKKIHSGDAINDIFHFAKRSVYKFISLGQTTLAYWDSRESNETDLSIPDDDVNSKRKVFLSDDQEDEILCGAFVDPENGETLICGMGEGLLTVWRPKKNNLADQLTRIKVCKGESIDCVISTLQDDNCVWCGCSNGNVYKVDVKTGKVVEIRKHSKLDEVSFMDLDYEYRLVSGGMGKVKIWEFTGDNLEEDGEFFHESSSDSHSTGSSDEDESESKSESEEEEEEEEEEECDENSNNPSESEPGSDVWEQLEHNDAELSSAEDDEKVSQKQVTLSGLSKEDLIKELDKDIMSSDSDSDSEDLKRSHEDDGKNDKLSKKKKKNNQLSSKQLKNLQQHEHGIKRFEGL